jgi:predicted lactoylglutathione lyase
MKLGAFSISLAVNNLTDSLDFYKKLGFEEFKGSLSHHWVIVKNGDCVIGLFEKMFEDNIMTFNPGWDNDANPIEEFDDIRKLKEEVERQGINLVSDNLEKEGPCSFMISDPDGNVILIDQHV